MEKAAADVRAREAELESLAASLADQRAAINSDRARLERKGSEIGKKMIAAEEMQVRNLCHKHSSFVGIIALNN